MLKSIPVLDLEPCSASSRNHSVVVRSRTREDYMKHQGLHAYRLSPKAGNPKEVRFALKWKEWNDLGHTLEYLLGDGQKKQPATDREIEVAATVIQWLGSPVVQGFLKECEMP